MKQNKQTPQKSQDARRANSTGTGTGTGASANTGTGVNANRTSANRPASSPAAKPPAMPPKGTATRGPQSGVKPRPTRPPQRKSGFSLRPLDIALLFVGVLLVGMLIWFGVNANNNNSASPSAAVNPAASTPNPGGATATVDTGSTVATPGSSPSKPPRNLTPLPAGAAATEFSLPANDGKTYTLSQFKGKVVLLEFFAPWCPHCQADAPILNQVYDAYRGKDVQMLAISASPYGKNYENNDNTPISMDDVTWFANTFSVKYPMLFDPETNTAYDYHIRYFPTLYVVDKNGAVTTQMIAATSNPITFERISAVLDNALK